MARAGIIDGLPSNWNVYHTIPLFASLYKQLHLRFVGRSGQLRVSEHMGSNLNSGFGQHSAREYPPFRIWS